LNNYIDHCFNWVKKIIIIFFTIFYFNRDFFFTDLTTYAANEVGEKQLQLEVETIVRNALEAMATLVDDFNRK